MGTISILLQDYVKNVYKDAKFVLMELLVPPVQPVDSNIATNVLYNAL